MYCSTQAWITTLASGTLSNFSPFSTSSRTVVARQSILHDAGHPSRIILPIVLRGERP